jgi:hypothetical protein
MQLCRAWASRPPALHSWPLLFCCGSALLVARLPSGDPLAVGGVATAVVVLLGGFLGRPRFVQVRRMDRAGSGWVRLAGRGTPGRAALRKRCGVVRGIAGAARCGARMAGRRGAVRGAQQGARRGTARHGAARHGARRGAAGRVAARGRAGHGAAGQGGARGRAGLGAAGRRRARCGGLGWRSLAWGDGCAACSGDHEGS